MGVTYIFRCRGCLYTAPTEWVSICPGCNRYYDIKRIPGNNPDGKFDPVEQGIVVSLCDVEADTKPRTPTLIRNLDRVLGKSTLDGSLGFADGQLIMIYGNPGSGKSTLLLQVANGVAKQKNDVLYLAGEESLEQIKERADRIGKFSKRVSIVKETDLGSVLGLLLELKPKLFIIDSLQKIEVENFMTGSISALNIVAREIEKFCKAETISGFLVVQVGKDESFQGPQSLEHSVDTSLFLKRSDDAHPRVLECHKNRFGPTQNTKFWMTEKGLVEIEEESDDEDMATQTAQAIPVLESIPLDLEKQFPNPNLAEFWEASDGTTAATVLAVKCDVDGCQGKIDRACTSANGTKESGFHAARIDKGRLAAKKNPVIDAASEIVFEAPKEPDPFDPGPLKSKPRLRRG